ncbi:MAG: outer membrane protein [Pseudolabrys sp.]
MWGFFISAAVAASLITFAQEAPAQPPSAQPPSAQIDRWTGWYVGLNAGGVWGSDPVSTTASNSAFCAPPSCNRAVDFANASIQGATGVFPLRTDGFIGGGQFGYNWKIASRWIAGFEADVQGLASAGNSSAASASYDVSGFANHSVGTDLSVSKSINFLGTVRGRLGYLLVPRLLVFGTGGFAYGHVKTNLAISQNLIGAGLGNFAASYGTVLNASRIQGGWVLGGGFEWMFASHWTARVEYLHYDLGSVTATGQLANRIVSPSPPTPYYFVNNVQSTTRFYGDIVRVGLNFFFGKNGGRDRD